MSCRMLCHLQYKACCAALHETVQLRSPAPVALAQLYCKSWLLCEIAPLDATTFAAACAGTMRSRSAHQCGAERLQTASNTQCVFVLPRRCRHDTQRGSCCTESVLSTEIQRRRDRQTMNEHEAAKGLQLQHLVSPLAPRRCRCGHDPGCAI